MQNIIESCHWVTLSGAAYCSLILLTKQSKTEFCLLFKESEQDKVKCQGKIKGLVSALSSSYIEFSSAFATGVTSDLSIVTCVGTKF